MEIVTNYYIVKFFYPNQKTGNVEYVTWRAEDEHSLKIIYLAISRLGATAFETVPVMTTKEIKPQTAAEVLNNWYMSLPEEAQQVSIPDRAKLQMVVENLLEQKREQGA